MRQTRRTIRRLWRGEVPLVRAFWWYAVGGGLALDALATLGLLALLSEDAPLFWLAVAYFWPLPYFLLTFVAVWRSAERYPSPPVWAQFARAAAVVWVVFEVVS